jgi:hypothetical protein
VPQRSKIGVSLEEALKTGVVWDEYLDAMRAWLAEKQTFDALHTSGHRRRPKGFAARPLCAENL